MEEVLLGDSGILSCKFRKSVGVVLGKYALYPYINGEGFYPVHTEKQNALRDFRTYPFIFFSPVLASSIGISAQPKGQSAGADLIAASQMYFARKPLLEVSQRVRSFSSKLLRLRGKVRCSYRIAGR